MNPRPFEAFCGALLVRFLPGQLLKEEQVQDPEILRRIGKSLVTYYESQSKAKRLSDLYDERSAEPKN